MAFSQSGISGVIVQSDGPELLIDWVSPSPEGTIFQVYVERRLSWFGTSRRCHVPIPAGGAGRNIWVEVATVGAGEAHSDYSSSLSGPGHGGSQTLLSWLGGTYLDPSGLDDIRGFRIYRSASPGEMVDWTRPIDEVPAYPGGWVSDGFGLGGFGLGGFGRSANSYNWTSAALPGGVWQFAVVPYDKAGNNRGTGQTVVVAVNSAPRPPAPAADGKRLSYSYSGPATRQVTLNWLASPSSLT
jgi:hypothetical protein